VRHLHGVPADGAELNAVVRARAEALRVLMLARTTQTNEPACCAVLLPVLARLPQPLALIEVGASAWLCLLPARYGYDYDGRTLLPDGNAAAPVFACTTSGAVPLPETLPQVCWRRRLDLNPLDQNDPDDAAWLETLVWPGQEARLQRLRAAVAVARAEPPIVVRGDLLADLETLMAEAPRHATLVLFHTAVLAYVGDRAARERFAAAMRVARAVWVSNESSRVFPDIARNAPAPARAGLFLLSVDGRPVAWTGPHGQSVEWFGDWFGDRIDRH
jgi:hypothetical protein